MMAEEKKFDPAPTDKHADDPKKARKADKETHDKLDKGLARMMSWNRLSRPPRASGASNA